ncbi:transcription factor/nuclear export subunit protein 2-domain-containing protein [Sporodiniella umbellata]|nr:transcription factor/nuclear export subunit protein 2-domain-containing protein [Sporodiniella umbellata]
MSEEIFEIDPLFEQELTDIKKKAEEYSRIKTNAFRTSISRSVTDTYRGRRSVPSFIRLSTAIIKDEDRFFKDKQINVFGMFTNTLKSMDIRLEMLRETEEVEEIKARTDILVRMINGLLDSEALSTNDCKAHFSSQLLKDCSIIPNILLFDRRIVRLNTAMLYKQHKFNLIREDNEGYGSLINEMTIISIGKRNAATTLDKIPSFLKMISSHIGVFHLDPNRVLDIILDFFIKQLAVNYVFWIQVIKQSSWVQELTFIDVEGETLTGPSAILSQLIGFRFYNYHTDTVSPAPKELYLTMAILLKNGLISLNHVIPHLLPYQEDMEALKNEYNKKMNKEITTNSGGKLALYGALGEEGNTQKSKRAEPPIVTAASAPAASTNDNEKQTYEANDVVELTKALFSIGDVKNAIAMTFYYDKLVDMFPRLAYDIYRLARFILQPAYEAYASEKSKQLYSRFRQCAEQSQLKSTLVSEEDRSKASLKLKRVLVTDALLDDVRDLKKMEHYVFFYNEWRDELECCESFEHLTTRFMPLMRLAGCRTYLATDLIQHLMLILSGLLDREKELIGCHFHLANMIREFLLPAISFSKGNPGTMASVWEILYRLSFQERYNLYGEWSQEFYKKNIETKLLKARVERAVKSVMRRVSKNDVRRCGRDLGKLAHSNPTIVFNVVLDQVQTFDNLAPIMADACRYLGDFSYDVLGFILTEKWTGSQGAGKTRKEKEKDDGMPATWLRSLATYTGMLFKKQDIDATPLLRYLVYRLRYDDSVADLILLNEFVTKMGGIEILASACTNDQITAAGCSDSIKSEAFLPISADNRRASRRVLSRLKESLRKNQVGFEILVLLYRLSEACLSESGIPASDRCSKLDRVHQTQLQYFELLTSLFEPEEYETLVPSIEVLVKEFGLPVHVAMTFNRPKTQHTIRTNLETPVTDTVWTPFKETIDLLPSLLDIPAIPAIFTSEFYFMFWQLSLYDIHCPVTHYEAAIKRHTDMISQCQDVRSSFCQNNRPSIVSKAERQAQAALDTLNEDLPKHQAYVQKVMTILRASQSRWFPSSMQRQALISNILQHCILPRSKLSEIDAAFCYEFSMLMHQINTVNFSSLTLFDKVLSDSLPADFIAFSEYETTIHSRFIFKALAKMGEWHKDEKLYSVGAHGGGLIGFQKNWNADASQGVDKEDLLHFTDFQRVLHKWHFRSCLAIEQALKSGESHVIKNAFLVLRQFIPCFPAVIDHGNSIIKIAKRLTEEEERGNIK